MRAIDRSRFLALHVVKMCAKSILDEASGYQKEYHSEGSVQEIMDNLDKIWELISTNSENLANFVIKEGR